MPDSSSQPHCQQTINSATSVTFKNFNGRYDRIHVTVSLGHVSNVIKFYNVDEFANETLLAFRLLSTNAVVSGATGFTGDTTVTELEILSGNICVLKVTCSSYNSGTITLTKRARCMYQ